MVQEILSVIRQGFSLSLNKKYTLVPIRLFSIILLFWPNDYFHLPERAGPVRVYLKLPPDILWNYQHLRQIWIGMYIVYQSSVCQIKETFLFANHLYKQSFLERSAFKIIEQKNNYLRDFFFTFLRILRFYMLKTRNVKSYFESFPRWRLCSSEITSLAHFSGFSLMLLRV